MKISGCLILRRISIPLFIIAFAFSGLHSTYAQSDSTSNKKARTIIHMLDYMAVDYPVAVKNGKIINKMEFREMKNFAVSIDSLYSSLRLKEGTPAYRSTANQIDSLHQLVLNKVRPDKIASAARSIKQKIIKLTDLTIAPRRWPNIQRGKQIYVKKCQTCHGAKGRGNGPQAPNLQPPPTNFHNDQRLLQISPYQAYNTIQMGVSGTSMRAYTELSDYEAWSLAFFVKSLRFKDDTVSTLPDPVVDSLLAHSSIDLTSVARLNDRQLKHKIRKANLEVNPARGMQSLRMYQPELDTSKFISKASSLLNKVKRLYANGEYQKAYQTALQAYLEGYEPVEAQLNALNSKLMRDIENSMIALRTKINNRVPVEELNQNIATIQQQLNRAQIMMEESETTPWLSFLLSASILLREGLEAFLVIITILSIMNSLGARRQKWWIHAGWITAVALGLIGWFFADWLMAMGGGNRELMEGAMSLFAVLILVYVGFWMHSKSEAKQWQEFIDSQIREKLQGGNLFGLFLVSFIAVFREAFESVIFLSAIRLEAGPTGDTAIGIGAIVALILLALIGYAIIKLTVKVPLRAIFRYGSYAIGLFAFMMAGQGIHALQEAGYLSVTPTPLPIQASLIGIYPTWETIGAQLLTLAVLVGLWQYSKE